MNEVLEQESTQTKSYKNSYVSSFPGYYSSDIESFVYAQSKGYRIPVKSSIYMHVKYVTSSIIALVGLLVLSPFLALVAFFIKLDSSGPIFYSQERLGLGGKPFNLLKFRTMIKDAHKLQDELAHLNEMKGGRLFKSDKDPRITKLGRILRKLSIDELPQLINIIKGDMTIIGPRPISTPLNEYAKDELVRFSVKPGLGAIWQAYFRGETDFKKWIKMDCIYVQNTSFGLDTKLFFIILFNVIRGKGAR